MSINSNCSFLEESFLFNNSKSSLDLDYNEKSSSQSSKLIVFNF